MTIRVYKSCFQTPFEKLSIISIHINISVYVPSIYRYVKCPTNDSSTLSNTFQIIFIFQKKVLGPNNEHSRTVKNYVHMCEGRLFLQVKKQDKNISLGFSRGLVYCYGVRHFEIEP